MDEIQVKCEEEKIKGEKVSNAADSSFHGYWINGFTKTDYRFRHPRYNTREGGANDPLI